MNNNELQKQRKVVLAVSGFLFSFAARRDRCTYLNYAGLHARGRIINGHFAVGLNFWSTFINVADSDTGI